MPYSIVPLEESFYVGEHGFSFRVKTDIDLTGVVEGEIKGVIVRPNRSQISKNISIGNITDAATGTLMFPVVDNDLNAEGQYTAQIYVKDSDLNISRPSHIFTFSVFEGLELDPDSLFT
jgi:hypothetical protein